MTTASVKSWMKDGRLQVRVDIKYNPNHGPDGRFSSGGGVASGGGFFTKNELALPANTTQPQSSKEEVLVTAAKVKQDYDNMMDHGKGIDKALGGTATRTKQEVEDAMNSDKPVIMLAPLKGDPRLSKKVHDKYDGDWGRVHDVVRGSVVVNKASDVRNAVDVVRKNMAKKGFELATAPEDRMANPCPGGYRDVQMKLRSKSTGMVVELQINTKPMIRAKKVGHDLYKKVRLVKEEAKAAGRSLTKSESTMVGALEKQMEKLYGDAWKEG